MSLTKSKPREGSAGVAGTDETKRNGSIVITKAKKNPDSNRTKEAKKRAIQRRVIRSVYKQNGGRF